MVRRFDELWTIPGLPLHRHSSSPPLVPAQQADICSRRYGNQMRSSSHRTSKLVRTSPRVSPFSQVTSMGHLPGVVFEPTRHCHTMRPLVSAVFGTRPFARDGPDLYATVIVQVAPGAVRISNVASLNGATGDDSETTETG